jgi:rubrerythrin
MARRIVFRRPNGRFREAPSLSELMPNVNSQAEVMTCGRCGHEWIPVLTTGCCPMCSNQEDHKFKEEA